MTPAAFDPATTARRLADAMAASGQPGPLYREIDAIAAETPGHRLLTVLAHRPETGEVERIYSSNPADYPLLGRKKMGPTPWGAHVLDAGEPWFGATPADIRWAFPDHELIASLGCGASLNAPVRHDGRVLGVLNLLDAEGAYVSADLKIATFLAPYLVPALLAATTPHEGDPT